MAFSNNNKCFIINHNPVIKTYIEVKLFIAATMDLFEKSQAKLFSFEGIRSQQSHSTIVLSFEDQIL